MVTCDEKLPESELNELLCEFKGGAALSVKMTFCEKNFSDYILLTLPLIGSQVLKGVFIKRFIENHIF